MLDDHADESDQRDDMPRAVEAALRTHGALDDEPCRAVAGAVWLDMQAAYDDIYGMWREEMRAARELERERDLLSEFMRDACAALKCEQNDEAALLVIDELKTELAEARRDVERLGYFERCGFSLRHRTMGNCDEPQVHAWVLVDPYDAECVTGWQPTLRAAIDAAMRGKK